MMEGARMVDDYGRVQAIVLDASTLEENTSSKEAFSLSNSTTSLCRTRIVWSVEEQDPTDSQEKNLCATYRFLLCVEAYSLCVATN